MLSKQIPGFDILKFIMAIGIVGVHCHLCQAVCLVNNFLGGGDFWLSQSLRTWFFYSLKLFIFQEMLESGL